MRPYASVFATLTFFALPVAQSQERPLGRLFFSAEQRALFDQQRQYDMQDAHAGLTLNGTVIRSSGRTTAWINHHPHHDHRARQALEVITHGAGQATFTLRGNTALEIKVGESVQPASRERSAAISIRPTR